MATKIKVNEVEYTCPTDKSEITLGQQMEIMKMVDRDDEFKNYHLVHTYTGIPIELIKQMNINQFELIINLLNFISVEPNFEQQVNSLPSEFEFNGHTYYLVDSLLKGQTQDYLSIQGVLKKYVDNQALALPFICAIVAKRNGETLDSYDVKERAVEFLGLPYSIAQDIWFFFVRTANVLQIRTPQSLEIINLQVEQSLRLAESSLKRSVGLGMYKRSVKTILLFYIRYISKSWKNFLTITR